jgi:hypothetical protein
MFDPPVSGAPRVVDSVPQSALLARTLSRATPGLATAVMSVLALTINTGLGTLSAQGATAPAGNSQLETQSRPIDRPVAPRHARALVYCAGTQLVGRCV